jgi:DNA-binding NarL/FixJ family response regulator
MLTNGVELLGAIPRTDPDVIVLDISMPGLDGFEAARRLKAAGCRSKLLFLTVCEDADFVREAMALGADGYVVKSRLATDLLTAVFEVLAERKYVSPTMMTVLAGDAMIHFRRARHPGCRKLVCRDQSADAECDSGPKISGWSSSSRTRT